MEPYIRGPLSAKIVSNVQEPPQREIAPQADGQHEIQGPLQAQPAATDPEEPDSHGPLQGAPAPAAAEAPAFQGPLLVEPAPHPANYQLTGVNKNAGVSGLKALSSDESYSDDSLEVQLIISFEVNFTPISHTTEEDVEHNVSGADVNILSSNESAVSGEEEVQQILSFEVNFTPIRQSIEEEVQLIISFEVNFTPIRHTTEEDFQDGRILEDVEHNVSGAAVIVLSSNESAVSGGEDVEHNVSGADVIILSSNESGDYGGEDVHQLFDVYEVEVVSSDGEGLLPTPDVPEYVTDGGEDVHQLFDVYEVEVVSSDGEGTSLRDMKAALLLPLPETYDIQLAAEASDFPPDIRVTTLNMAQLLPVQGPPRTVFPFSCPTCCRAFSSGESLAAHVLQGIAGDFTCRVSSQKAKLTKKRTRVEESKWSMAPCRAQSERERGTCTKRSHNEGGSDLGPPAKRYYSEVMLHTYGQSSSSNNSSSSSSSSSSLKRKQEDSDVPPPAKRRDSDLM